MDKFVESLIARRNWLEGKLVGSLHHTTYREIAFHINTLDAVINVLTKEKGGGNGVVERGIGSPGEGRVHGER